MLKYKLIALALFLKSLVGKVDFEAQRLDMRQSKSLYKIEKVGWQNTPEISGLKKYDGLLYFIVDSGGEPEVYVINEQLQLLDTLAISATNRDWEAITMNDQGDFFISDLGNNLNRRQDLSIYNVSQQGLKKLEISYDQQTAFPPVKDEMNFDAEALTWLDGQLHIFSKNRGKKCVKHYIMSDSATNTTLAPVEELWLNSQITGADVSPDGSVIALLGYGKIYFFKLKEGRAFSNPFFMIETTRFGQSEAIAFLSEDELMVANEKGKFLKVTLNKKKLDEY